MAATYPKDPITTEGQCHEHNPVNHFEYLPAEDGGDVVHPALRRRLQVEPAMLGALVQAGLLRGRLTLSFTFDGIRYCQSRRRF